MSDTPHQISILQGYDTLSERQKNQFRQVIMEGLRGKFLATLGDDADGMLSIVEIWIRYGFLPMSKAFCAVKADDGSVVSILLLNDFNQPDGLESVRCLLSVMRVIGIRKALKIAFQFLAVDNINKEPNPENIISEIYLVSTLESERGNGIGAALIRYVLDDLRAACSSRPSQSEDRRVKLLVFEKNPAIGLYERLGFRRTSSVATPKIAKAFGDAYDVLVRMERAV